MDNIAQTVVLGDYKQVLTCSKEFIIAINEALNVVNGKWKMPIIGSLMFGEKRFSDLAREIPKITPRMLSKELKELELNGILYRKTQSQPQSVVYYKLTKSGETLKEVLDTMVKWGLEHRQRSLKLN